jgi:cytochrome oxidase Cu insertion factor (SCO1/SenC/PrrC family)
MTPRLNRRVPLLALIVMFSLAGLATARAEDAVDVSAHPWIGKDAPDFKLATVAGGELSLKDLRGNYVVIHFGTSW